MPEQAPEKGTLYQNACVAMACKLLCWVADPAWAYLKQAQVDLADTPPKALRAKSSQHMARLEETRAAASELLASSGGQYLYDIFRGGAIGARSVSTVTKDREREVRAKSCRPAEAGAAASSSARPAPYAKQPPPNPPKGIVVLQRTRSSPPAPHSVTAKAAAIIQGVYPSCKATSTTIRPTSQSVVMAVAKALSSIPKAAGMEFVEQACPAQSISVGGEVSLSWPLVISLLVNMLLVTLVLRLILKRDTEIRIVCSQQHVRDAEASGGRTTDLSPDRELRRPSTPCFAPCAPSDLFVSTEHGLSASAVVVAVAEVVHAGHGGMTLLTTSLRRTEPLCSNMLRQVQ